MPTPAEQMEEDKHEKNQLMQDVLRMIREAREDGGVNDAVLDAIVDSIKLMMKREDPTSHTDTSEP